LNWNVELVEFFAVLSGDDELGGGDPCCSRISGRAGLAFLGARAGARRALAALAFGVLQSS